jgi:hypothetical protein
VTAELKEAKQRLSTPNSAVLPAKVDRLEQYIADSLNQLARGGIRWANGSYYVALSRLLHRAEEFAISVASVEPVIGYALDDDSRLRNSQIVGRDRLLADLSLAVSTLARDPSCSKAPNVPTAADAARRTTGPSIRWFRRTWGLSERTEDSTPLEGATSRARSTVATVERLINDFRDGQWAGLVRGRGRLRASIAFAGLITYILLSVPVVAEVDHAEIMETVSLYVVRAVVGLFSRLYRESTIDSAGEDYGLSAARLTLTPLLSGIAAIGGVFIFTMLTVQNVQSVTGNVGGYLTAILPLLLTPYSIIVAAIFGLTPSLLISSLQQQTTKLSEALRSTQGDDVRTSPTT